MISYEPLWQTMKRHGATTYTLQAKAGISSSTIRRMQANESVSTNTLDTLCKFFNCELGDIVKFQPDEKQHGEMVIAVSPCFFLVVMGNATSIYANLKSYFGFAQIVVTKRNWHRIAHTLGQSCPFAVNPNLLYLVQSKLCNAAVPVGTAVFICK